MNINIDNIDKYTTMDFGIALRNLLNNKELSYHQLSYECKLTASYLQQIATKKVLPPKDENIKRIAKALKVEPEYFYEYRLRRLINLINDSREYLDLFLKEIELSQKKRKAQKARIRAKKMAEAKEVAK